MANMTIAQLNSQDILIDDAVDLRDRSSVRPDFRCIECDEPVRAHKAGGHVAAHFEHLNRNANCSLSHRAR